ncbi:MAG: pentapeptide repeat-containing protein [Prochloraceae cyanobacterium]|nr:pentapeptide repeat-containing protein [Prochloraceae cyanobacterium]
MNIEQLEENVREYSYSELNLLKKQGTLTDAQFEEIKVAINTIFSGVQLNFFQAFLVKINLSSQEKAWLRNRRFQLKKCAKSLDNNTFSVLDNLYRKILLLAVYKSLNNSESGQQYYQLIPSELNVKKDTKAKQISFKSLLHNPELERSKRIQQGANMKKKSSNNLKLLALASGIITTGILAIWMYNYSNHPVSRLTNEGKCVKCNFKQMNLAAKNLPSVNLKSSNFSNANLNGIQLTGSELRKVDFKGATILDGNLNFATLTNANFQSAKLRRISLTRANLVNANLSHANLVNANLKNANLIDANLQGAILQGANLEGAKLIGADLTGADLTGANLKNANLDGAIIDENALLSLVDLHGAIWPNGQEYQNPILSNKKP